MNSRAHNATTQNEVAQPDEEHARAQHQLRLIGSAFECSNDAVLIADPAGTSVYHNRAFLVSIDYTVDELVAAGGVVKLFVDPTAALEVVAKLQRSHTWQGEVDLRTRRGEVQQVALRLGAIGNSQHVLGSIILCTTTTAQRQIAAEPRAAEERYQLLFDGSPQPLWVYDLATLSILLVNEIAIRHYGYSRTEFLALTLRDIDSADGSPAPSERATRLPPCVDGRSEARHRTKDNRIIDVESYSRQVMYDGRAAGLMMAIDVTECKQAERRAATAQQQLFKVFNAGPEPQLISRYADGRCLYVNNSFVEATGYTPDEVIDGSTHELGVWADAADRRRLFRRLAACGRLYKEEIDFRRKSGEVRTGLLSAEIIDIDDQRCVLTLMSDITERRGRERAAQAAAARLGEQSRCCSAKSPTSSAKVA